MQQPVVGFCDCAQRIGSTGMAWPQLPPPHEPVRRVVVSSLSTRNAGEEGRGEGGTRVHAFKAWNFVGKKTSPLPPALRGERERAAMA